MFGPRRKAWITHLVPGTALALALVAAVPTGFAQIEPAALVELELVLAVDCSSSVSGGEFKLQMRGIAGALRDPGVIAAIEATAPLGVAISLMQWSSEANQVIAIDWTLLRDGREAAALAERIEATPRRVGGGTTAIGTAITVATGLLRENAYIGRRRVIDISGDGPDNQGVAPKLARAVATTSGITINGLAILNKDNQLGRYYLDQVVGGSNAFMLTANKYSDLARAMREKLITEIKGPPVAFERDGPMPPSLAKRQSP